MCPSFRATGDERDLTRGRANTLRLALSGQLGRDDEAEEAVRDALDLCVSCKGCRRECPTGVDMARMKIEFLAHYKRRHGHTLRDKLVGHMPRYAHWAARLQPLTALAQRLPGAGAMVEALGFDRRRPLPAWRRSWRSTFRDKTAGAGSKPIVLFADTFNNWFEPENLAAAQRVLEATGHAVISPTGPDGRALCCGRTYLAVGMVAEARAEMRRTMQALRPFVEAGTPVVGLEPSLPVHVSRRARALPGDASPRGLRVQLADEYLAAELRAGRLVPPWRAAPGASIRVHGHCHQKSFGTFDATLELLRTLPGAEVQAIESSCCGMAGAFGHEMGHYDASMKMAEAALLPAVRGAPGATIVAAGTSCRRQIADGCGRAAKHPLVLLAECL